MLALQAAETWASKPWAPTNYVAAARAGRRPDVVGHNRRVPHVFSARRQVNGWGPGTYDEEQT